MQKKIIAVAVAGLVSGAAFAESNVTVYGVGDLTVENVRVSGTGATATDVPTKGRAANNSSYIGFKGSEDLGSGLKAVFQLETAVTLGTNADTNGGVGAHAPASNQFGASRDSFVGLAGGFGTIAAGTVTGPYRALGTKVSYSLGAAGVGYLGAVYGTIGGIKTSTDDRTTNALAYISPNMSGFSATVAYSFDANKDNAPATAGAKALSGALWTLGLNYANGPVDVGYAHINAKDPQVARAAAVAAGAAAAPAAMLGIYTDKLTADRVAGKFSFGDTSVTALYDRQKYSADFNAFSTVAAGSGWVKRNAWQIGAGQKLGANEIYAEYGRAGNLKESTGDVADTKLTQWTIGYNYNMSKRTLVKAYWTQLDNKAKSGANFYNNAVANSGTAGYVANNGDLRAVGVGLRHSF